MSGGTWATQRERQQIAADRREQEREILRIEKRTLRDLRWAAERSTLEPEDWADLFALQREHGKEGVRQLVGELIPYWRTSQRLNGGADVPAETLAAYFPQVTGKKTRSDSAPVKAPANRTRATPGAPRKTRSNKGVRQPDRKRKSANKP